jgi:hypothetical protein
MFAAGATLMLVTDASSLPTKTFALAEIRAMPSFVGLDTPFLPPDGFSLWEDRLRRLIVTHCGWAGITGYMVRPIIRVRSGRRPVGKYER